MTQKQLEKLNNDMMIATTMLSVAIDDEEFEELTSVMEMRYLDTVKDNALFLKTYAEEIEQFEVCGLLQKIIEKLNK
jgi:hypothetical protein